MIRKKEDVKVEEAASGGRSTQNYRDLNVGTNAAIVNNVETALLRSVLWKVATAAWRDMRSTGVD